jgi:hypothetical protein
LGAKGNDIVVAFVADTTRAVDIDYGAETITITFTYIAGDNANDMVEEFLLAEAEGVVTLGIGTVPGIGLIHVAGTLSSQNIVDMIEFEGDLYATTSGGRLFTFNESNAWVQVAPQLTTYYARTLFILNDSLYAEARNTANSTSNNILKFNGTDSWEFKIDSTGIINYMDHRGHYIVLNNVLYMFKWMYYIYKWDGISAAWVIEYYYYHRYFYPASSNLVGNIAVLSPFSGEENIIYFGAFWIGLFRYDVVTQTGTFKDVGVASEPLRYMVNYEGNIYYIITNTTIDNFRKYTGTGYVVCASTNGNANMIVYNNRIYSYHYPYSSLKEFNGVDAFVERAPTIKIACVHNGKLYCTISGTLYYYNYVYPTEILDDQTEQLTGGFTPELEILGLEFE